MDKTLYQVFDEFLKEQRARLKPRTYKGYEDAIALFADYLDGYAYQHPDGEDSELYARLHQEDKDVMKFVRWMGERRYLGEEEYEATIEVVDELRGVLPKAEELSDLLFEYISYQMKPRRGMPFRMEYRSDPCFQGDKLPVRGRMGDLSRLPSIKLLGKAVKQSLTSDRQNQRWLAIAGERKRLSRVDYNALRDRGKSAVFAANLLVKKTRS